MRAIQCPCGHHLEGADDEELIRLAREHVESHHAALMADAWSPAR
jgi:predicted small metal-binding protein